MTPVTLVEVVAADRQFVLTKAEEPGAIDRAGAELVIIVGPCRVAEIRSARSAVGDGGVAARREVSEFQAAVVDDGGAAACAGVSELQPVVVDDGGAAGGAGVQEVEPATVGNGGAAGGAGVREHQ